jgi:hypothetical protein
VAIVSEREFEISQVGNLMFQAFEDEDRGPVPSAPTLFNA